MQKAIKTAKAAKLKTAARGKAVDLELMRGHTQTVRMDAETLKALKYASIERGISQNDIMLAALRKDLGSK